MSRSKIRQIDQIHIQKRKIKELNETIKKLEREVNNNNKAAKKVAKAEPIKPTPVQGGCPECIAGKVEIVELGARRLLTCTERCGYRKVIKNG